MAADPDDPLVVPFPGSAPMARSEVGGKGRSLLRLANAGFSVPPGVVLPTAFFAPWFERIQTSEVWSELTKAAPDEWASLCEALQDRCSSLAWTDAQTRALSSVRAYVRAGEPDGLLAVRSSAPEEDRGAASFAGGYETRLGVPSAHLEAAVRHCFASSLDERVLVYKKEHGLDPFAPRLAVVVQQQIDSDVAGVGFSINPVTNDYDEAVIDASWGLGTTVVEGRVSPDHFVVDKVARTVLEEKRGDKEVAVTLGPNGGTSERIDARTEVRTLSAAQLREVTDLLCQIEALYERPVDVEWAYADGTLHVLQARPITAYVPLPPDLVTQPGERRRLYADFGLAKGMTINAPISPLGLDWMRDFMQGVAKWAFGALSLNLDPSERLLFLTGGRTYQNLSVLLTLRDRDRLAEGLAESDSRIAEILKSVDADRYRAPERPSWASLRMAKAVPRVLWRLGRMGASVLSVFLAPDRAWTAYQRTVGDFEARMTADLDFSLPLDDFRQQVLVPTIRNFFTVTGPAFGAAFLALRMVDRVVAPAAEAETLAPMLKRGFRGNLVTEMGIALYQMAQRLEPADVDDLSRLATRIEEGDLPDAFLRDWDRFLDRWGCRGPNEMDLALPRYADQPTLALRQMSFMVTDQEDFDPAAAHERLVAEREAAYETLMSCLGGPRRWLLRRLYRVIDRFAGTRDTLKHHLLVAFRAVRKRVLMEGRRLADAGRLDAPKDVFSLTFDDLAAADDDPSLDLRARREERTRFRKTLEAHVSSFPPVIDSRGRIPRPPSPETADGFRGMGVSPGVATGPVKVLHSAHKTPVEKGDVLVAVTTDPGWTPLFVNAAAVVLEVGGVLQHGAVVAREYGKPCVVGLDRATEILHDGQRVEVDGATGTVRLRSQ